MREIKFRGKMPNGAWVYGSFWDHAVYPDIIDEYTNHRLVDRDTVGQFTGLLDSDGKEIYEGDIVHWTEGEKNALVVWRAGEFDVDLMTGPCCIGALACLNPFDDDGPKLTVIGNIHDNPDLVEAKNA